MWKPVILDNDVLSGGIEGLIGIEELRFDDTAAVKNSVKLVKKRKANVKKPLQTENGSKKLKVPFKRKTFDENDLSFLSKMQSWAGFNIRTEILKALYDKGFTDPTEIQLKCLGPALSGRDVLACAETGSGKTLAFGLPMINGILKLKEKNEEEKEKNEEESDNEEGAVDEEDWESGEVNVGCVKVTNLKEKRHKSRLLALVLAPTRELAVQVKAHMEDIATYTDVRIALVVGGLAHEKQERLLSKGPEIVVATPGRLWELISNGTPHLQSINTVRYLAVDETDRMLERGHFDELGLLLERINFNEKDRSLRQNFVLSATLTMVHDPPSYLKGKKRKRVTPGQKLRVLMDKIGITDPKTVDITGTKVTAENLTEMRILCEFQEKDLYLYYFIKKHEGRVIVFCNSIGCVKRLANLLNILSLRPLPIHASMEQKQRLRNLDKFRASPRGLLLATDVAARGLDIAGVDHVVHYQVPRSAEAYVHRSGRTARAGHAGSALLMVEPSEHSAYVKLLHTLGRDKDIEDLTLDDDTLQHLKKIIFVARDIDQLSLAVRKDASAQSWYRKAAEELDIIIDEDDLPKEASAVAMKKIRKDLARKQKELTTLMDRPVLPRRFSGKYPDVNCSREVRRDLLKIPGAFVLKKVPFDTVSSLI